MRDLQIIDRLIRMGINGVEYSQVPDIFFIDTLARYILLHPTIFRDILAADLSQYERSVSGALDITIEEQTVVNTILLIEIICILRLNESDEFESLISKIDKINLKTDLMMEKLEKLQECCDKVDNKLNDIINNMNLFKDELTTSINEGFENLTNLINENVEKLNGTLNRISNKIQQLAVVFENGFTELRDAIDQTYRNLNRLIVRLLDTIEAKLETVSSRLENKMQEVVTQINSLISNRFDDLTILINNRFTSLQQYITDKLNTLFEDNSPYWVLFDNHLNQRLTFYTNQLINTIRGGNVEVSLTSIEILCNTIATTTSDTLISVELLNAQIVRISGLAISIQTTVAVIEATAIAIEATAGYIKSDTSIINSKTNQLIYIFEPFKPTYFDYLNEIFSETIDIQGALEKYQKDHHDSIVQLVNEGCQKSSKIIADETSNRIVGETWAKWNATTSTFPCIVIIMKETGDRDKQRRSQIKLRYLKEEITDEIVTFLRNKFLNLSSFSYNWGTLRCNFISKNKLIKTTLYVSEKEDVVNILNTFLPLIEINWDENDLTFTEGKRRQHLGQINKTIAGVQPYVDNYNEKIKMDLFKAVIIGNGLEKPIPLYQYDG